MTGGHFQSRPWHGGYDPSTRSVVIGYTEVRRLQYVWRSRPPRALAQRIRVFVAAVAYAATAWVVAHKHLGRMGVAEALMAEIQ